MGVEPLGSDIVVDSMIVDSGSVSSAIAKIFTEKDQVESGRDLGQRSLGDREKDPDADHGPMRSSRSRSRPKPRSTSRSISLTSTSTIRSFRKTTGEPQMDVLLVAVKKDKILNYTNVLSLAGKSPAIVDIDAFALQNCYEYNYEPAPGTTVALLNLGASVMNINIVKGTTPLFTRDVSVGGNQYTDSLQKELDLGFEDAEALKLGQRVGTVSEDAKLPILQQVTEIIVLEIQKTFDFFRATAARRTHRAYLPGRWIFKSPRLDRGFAAGILASGGSAESLPAHLAQRT